VLQVVPEHLCQFLAADGGEAGPVLDAGGVVDLAAGTVAQDGHAQTFAGRPGADHEHVVAFVGAGLAGHVLSPGAASFGIQCLMEVGADETEDLQEGVLRRQGPFEGGTPVHHGEGHAADLVTLDELGKLGGVDHVRADVFVGDGQLMGQVDHPWTVGAGEGDEDLQVHGRVDAPHPVLQPRRQVGFAAGDPFHGHQQGLQLVPFGDPEESYAVVLRADHRQPGDLVDTQCLG